MQHVGIAQEASTNNNPNEKWSSSSAAVAAPTRSL